MRYIKLPSVLLLIGMFFFWSPLTILAQKGVVDESYTLARKLYDDQLYDLAAEEFHQFAEKSPESPQAAHALYMAGMSYFNSKKYSEAQKEFLALILKYPDTKDLDQANYKIAECFEAKMNYEAAANSYRQVQIFYPKSPLAEQALFLSAQMYFNANRFENTVEVMSEFFELHPISQFQGDARLLLADAFIALKKYDRAMAELDKILSLGEANLIAANALLKKGNIYFQLGHITEAEDNLLKLIDKYTKINLDGKGENKSPVPQAYRLLAEIYKIKGLYEKSNEMILKIPNYQNNASDLFLIADNLFHLKKYSPAIDYYQKVTAIPDTAQAIIAFIQKGHCYQELADYANAVAAYRDAIRLSEHQQYLERYPEYIHIAYQNLANCLIYLQQPKLAISSLNEYRTKANTNYYDVIDFQIAELYEKEVHDYERAIRAYYLFMDSHPNSKLIDEVQLGLARCYENLGNWSQALLEYQSLQKNYPASKYAQAAIKRIQYINNYFPLRDQTLNKIGNLMQQLLERQSDAITLYELGLLHFNDLRDYRSSGNLFKKVLNLNSPEVKPDEVLYDYGRSLQLLGEKTIIDKNEVTDLLDSAKYAYDRLLQNYPESKFSDDAAFHLIEIEHLLQKGNYKELLSSFIFRYPDSPLLERAYFELGLLLLKSEKISAIDSLDIFKNFNLLITKFPQSPLKADATFFIYLLQYQRNDIQHAFEGFNRFINEFSNSYYACQAYFHLANICNLNKDYTRGIKYLNDISTKFFYNEYADSAKLLITQLLKADQKYSDAISIYKALYEEYNRNGLVLAVKKDTAALAAWEQVTYELADIYKLVNDPIQAKIYLLAYLRHFPRGKYIDRALFALAELQDQEKSDEQKNALSYLKQLERDASPNSELIPYAFIKMADVFFNTNDYISAKNYYSKALAFALPEDTLIYARSQSAICSIRMNDLVQADRELKEFERLYKNELDRSAAIMLEKGNYYLENKSFKEAEKIFKDIKSNFKKSRMALVANVHLIKLYFILNRDKEALELATELLETNPNDSIISDVYMMLGNFYYLQAKQIENAMLAYKKAIEREDVTVKNLKIGMNNLIRCYADLQMWDKAIALSKEYVQKFPDDDDNLEKKIQIGYFYYRLKEYDYAIHLFKSLKSEASLESEPRIQYWIGDCYFEKGDYAKAIQEYMKIVYLSRPTKLLNQYQLTAQYQSGVAYIKLGKYENAAQLFEKIVKEQGAESVFGKPAKEKLEEIKRLQTKGQ